MFFAHEIFFGVTFHVIPLIIELFPQFDAILITIRIAGLIHTPIGEFQLFLLPHPIKVWFSAQVRSRYPKVSTSEICTCVSIFENKKKSEEVLLFVFVRDYFVENTWMWDGTIKHLLASRIGLTMRSFSSLDKILAKRIPRLVQ